MTPKPSTPPDFPLAPRDVATMRRRLLAWYAAHEQPFAWRTGGDPYSALVAAVAAQQTQMARVVEVHERWMAAFPTIGDLARADRAEVLRVWGRAGYPRRAVGLHETARRCMEQHHGALPRDLAALLALPGVGPFTAAIVLTFGWGDDAPAIDTNIVRVIGRVVYGDLQPARETSTGRIEAAAAALFPAGQGARWNPALMDYGGHVCLPRPRCDECVITSICAARPRFAAGEVAEPVRAQGRFDGSDRQWRGALMQALRDAHADSGAAMTERALLARLAAAGLDDPERARRLLAALVADGLAWREPRRGGARVGLGSAPSTT